jgi:hypothetical protein
VGGGGLSQTGSTIRPISVAPAISSRFLAAVQPRRFVAWLGGLALVTDPLGGGLVVGLPVVAWSVGAGLGWRVDRVGRWLLS